MTLPFDVEEPAPIPGAGPTTRLGLPFSVPIPSTSASGVLLGGDQILCGWALIDSGGGAGASAELYDGGSSGGVLLGAITFQGGPDNSASQVSAAQSASGANAIQTASITPAAGVTAFITSLRITGLGATAAAQVTATLAGVLGGTINYPVSVPAGVTVPITPVFDGFGTRGLRNSAGGVAITATLPAFGAGNTLEQIEINGYFLSTLGLTDRQWFGLSGIYVRTGLFLNMISGTVKGTFWIRQ